MSAMMFCTAVVFSFGNLPLSNTTATISYLLKFLLFSAACGHSSDDGHETACGVAGIQQKLAQHLSAFLSRLH